MKIDNLPPLTPWLKKNGSNTFVYAVIAKELHTKKQAMDTIISFFSNDSREKLSIVQFDGLNGGGKGILQELETLSFFSKNLLVVNNAEKINKQVVEKIINYSKNPSKNHKLLLLFSTLTSTTLFYKALEKNGLIVTLAPLKAWQQEKVLTQEVIKSFLQAGKKIDNATSASFVSRLGCDGFLIDNEIEKLLCYVGKRDTITLQDLDAITTKMHTETLWQVADAIFYLDGPTAQRISKEIVSEPNDLIPFLKQLRSQVQTKFQILSILSEGAQPEDITRQYAYMKGKILQQNIAAAKNYGLERCRKALIAIDATDLTARNSMISEDILVQQLIANLIT